VELKIISGKKSKGLVCLSSYLSGEKKHHDKLEGGLPVLEITDEYSNSLRYEISDS
jgi:hypothetical protein